MQNVQVVSTAVHILGDERKSLIFSEKNKIELGKKNVKRAKMHKIMNRKLF